MIDQEIEYFFTRFAGGAGPNYAWSLVEDGRIRAWVDIENEVCLCPVSAQYTLETGIVTSDDMANIAAAFLHLSVPAREAIFSEADNIRRTEIRKRLLDLCHLR